DPGVPGSGLALEARGGTLAGIHVLASRGELRLASFAGRVERSLATDEAPLASLVVDRATVDYFVLPEGVATPVELVRTLGVDGSGLRIDGGALAAQLVPFEFGHASRLDAWQGRWGLMLYPDDAGPV